MLTRRYRFVLVVYPSSRGLAYVVFEGLLSPLDWGVKEVRGRNRHGESLRIVRRLLEQYQPETVVLQDTSRRGTTRAERIRTLNLAIGELAEVYGIPVYAYSRAQVRQCFASFAVTTKQTIAEAIIKHIPAFKRYLPPPRRPWMSEHARMSLFDAAALGITHFNTDGMRCAA